MIDTHIHVTLPGLPGVGPLSPLLEQSAEVIASTLRREMQSAGVTAVLAMGNLPGAEDDPLGVAATLAIGNRVPGLHALGVADPRRTEPDHLRRVDALLAAGQVKALKGYLGYLHFAPDHPSYAPYFELSTEHNIPFVFHTGDTYSPRAKLRFAHPLLVDEVAVDHPRVRFVLAHLSNPWLTEAAEVVYKNVNVWADLSGLLVGDAETFTSEPRQELMLDVASGVRRAFRYAERPNRFLYGSDWPLAPMSAYRDFVRSAIPEVHHQQVFEDNARALFGI